MGCLEKSEGKFWGMTILASLFLILEQISCLSWSSAQGFSSLMLAFSVFPLFTFGENTTLKPTPSSFVLLLLYMLLALLGLLFLAMLLLAFVDNQDLFLSLLLLC